MMRALGFAAYLGDRFLDRVNEEAHRFEERRIGRKEAARIKELRAMDADEVRKEGDIGSLILARHIEIAKGLPDDVCGQSEPDYSWSWPWLAAVGVIVYVMFHVLFG